MTFDAWEWNINISICICICIFDMLPRWMCANKNNKSAIMLISKVNDTDHTNDEHDEIHFGWAESFWHILQIHSSAWRLFCLWAIISYILFILQHAFRLNDSTLVNKLDTFLLPPSSSFVCIQFSSVSLGYFFSFGYTNQSNRFHFDGYLQIVLMLFFLVVVVFCFVL